MLAIGSNYWEGNDDYQSVEDIRKIVCLNTSLFRSTSRIPYFSTKSINTILYYLSGIVANYSDGYKNYANKRTEYSNGTNDHSNSRITRKGRKQNNKLIRVIL